MKATPKAVAVLLLATLTHAQVSDAEERNYALEMGEVDVRLSCFTDFECTVEDLSYLEGIGKPLSQLDVCCATFPQYVYDGTGTSGMPTVINPKYCYSKKILSNQAGVNMYT